MKAVTTKDTKLHEGTLRVVPALREEEPILANLLELYAHDFSEFLDIELGPDGRFGYQDLPLYWREAGRHAFLIRRDGKLVGLALVKQSAEFLGSEPVWDMAEFFVVRAHRRLGLGRAAAFQVWRNLPGRWQVRVMEANEPARRFWDSAISTFTNVGVQSIRVEKAGKPWRVFAFESTSGA